MFKQLAVAGPPVKRLLTPWKYSWATTPLSISPSICTVPPGVPDKVTFTLLASCAAIMAPSKSDIITAGIVMVLSVPPIMIGAPATLFTMITAIAPAACAFSTLAVKAHVPLLIRAIFPAKAPAFDATTQASCVAAALSL